MKNIILLAILLMTSAVMAGERITILEDRLSQTIYNQTQAQSSFYMDTVTGMGYAKVKVTDYRFDFPQRPICDRFGCIPGGTGSPIPTIIYTNQVEIPGLNLTDNQMIYESANGPVNCGRLGTSRVLRRPTLYLSGKCKLRTRLIRNKLTVDFIVK